MGPLPGMHHVVLLQVGKLGEALLTQGTLERALPTVHTQMDLSQVWEKGCRLPGTVQQGLGSCLNLSPCSPRTLISHQGFSVPLLLHHCPQGLSSILQDTLSLSGALWEGR